MAKEIKRDQPSRRRHVVRLVKAVVGCVLTWLITAYVIAPLAWTRFSQPNSSFEDAPRLTQTSDHHPGDPLNVALIGSEEQLTRVMVAAKWYPAASLSLKSDVKIAVDTVLSRPDETAPVSNLFLFGRKQDLAFEQPVGHSPRHRHHVRFWKTGTPGGDGRTQWIGSAVYDERVGLSRTTGEITHVTAPDVDAERDYLLECLENAGGLAGQYVVDGYHTQREGRNGGGNLWHTDGRLYVGIIVERSP
ncbi:MAG: LssY C-terminal domain-containing protein [Pirellulales bacterium]